MQEISRAIFHNILYNDHSFSVNFVSALFTLLFI